MASRGAGQTSGKHLPRSRAGQTSDLHLPDRAGMQVRCLAVHVKRPASRSYKDAGQNIFKTAFCCCFEASPLILYVLNDFFRIFLITLWENPQRTVSSRFLKDKNL